LTQALVAPVEEVDLRPAALVLGGEDDARAVVAEGATVSERKSRHVMRDDALGAVGECDDDEIVFGFRGVRL
jgi:hypothetical protein